jgi:hypothetical protein
MDRIRLISSFFVGHARLRLRRSQVLVVAVAAAVMVGQRKTLVVGALDPTYLLILLRRTNRHLSVGIFDSLP